MNQVQLRILLVAADGADYSAVRAIPLLETVAYNDAAVATEPGADELYDAILLDGELASPEVIAGIVAANPRLPLILVARDDAQEELALAALQQGADDYLLASELTSVGVCTALRNARRARKLLAERDQARHQLRTAQAQGYGVPLHFAEQLRGSLNLIDQLASALKGLADPDAPLAAMSGTLAEEAAAMRRLAEDLIDAHKLSTLTVELHRRTRTLGEIAEEVCGLPASRALRMLAEADWEATCVCDRDKTVRAIGHLAHTLQDLLPAAEVQLAPAGDRIGLRLLDAELSPAQRAALLDPLPAAAGEAGFQRQVALGLLAAQQITVEADPHGLWFDVPGDAWQLSQRWTAWRVESNERLEVTLMTASVSGDADAELANAFLHNAVTARDLVLVRASGQWLVALSASGPEAQRRMRSLQQMWRVVMPEGELRQRMLATFPVPAAQQELTSRIQSLLKSASRRIVVVDDGQTPSPLHRRLAEAGHDVVAVDSTRPLAESTADADCIVADAESIERMPTLPPNVPVFLLSDFQRQQRRLEQNVRLITGQGEHQYDELIAALTHAPPPHRRGSLEAATSQ